MAIPQKIFQTARSFETLPEEIKENISRLKTLNPRWTYKLYEDEEMKNYIRQNVSDEDWNQLGYLNPKYNVVLADLFRYLIMYNEGGVYLDIKSTVRRSLDEALPSDCSYVISQWRNKLGQQYQWAGLYPELAHVPGGEFQQWFIVAREKHPFLKAASEASLRNIREYTPKRFGVSKIGVLRLSGPICYTNAIWPLVSHYDYSPIDAVDLGFQYSIYEDHGNHDKHTENPNHYSRVSEPIVLRDVYTDSVPVITLRLGDLLAEELRENTDIALKLAVFAIFSTITFALSLPIIIGWLFAR